VMDLIYELSLVDFGHLNAHIMILQILLKIIFPLTRRNA
jgi:hypothetical protein